MPRWLWIVVGLVVVLSGAGFVWYRQQGTLPVQVPGLQQSQPQGESYDAYRSLGSKP